MKLLLLRLLLYRGLDLLLRLITLVNVLTGVLRVHLDARKEAKSLYRSSFLVLWLAVIIAGNVALAPGFY